MLKNFGLKEEEEEKKESLTQQPQDYAPKGGHSNRLTDYM